MQDKRNGKLDLGFKLLTLFFKKGRGIYYYSNGDVYIGDWKEDKFDGTGTYLFQNGERY